MAPKRVTHRILPQLLQSSGFRSLTFSQRLLRTPECFWIYAGISLGCAFLAGLRPLNFVADDSLFYLVIGDHIARGDGSTFNGLFLTNGYHPLWELIVSGLARFPHTKASLAVYGALLQGVLNVATWWILSAALKPTYNWQARIVFSAFMLIFFAPLGSLYWTEAPLNMLFVALVVDTLLSEAPVSYLHLGLVLGLLFLSRLDNVFLIGCVFAYLWVRDRNWRLLIAAAACGAIAGIYLLQNKHQFGHLMPISGAIKSSVYRGRLFVGRLGIFGTISLCGAIALALSMLISRSRPRRYRLAMLVLPAGVVMHALYVLLLTDGDTTWIWYYVQGYLCLALLAAEVATACRCGVPLAVTLFGGVALLSCTIAEAQWSAWTVLGHPLHDATWRSTWLADIQRAMSEDQSVIVVADQPGLYAYGTSHPVFAVDGLTSNYQQDATLAANGMYSEIVKNGPAYLISAVTKPGDSLVINRSLSQVGVQDGQIVHFRTPLTGTDAGCIFISNSGLLTSSPAPLIGATWGLWKLTPATMQRTTCQ